MFVLMELLYTSQLEVQKAFGMPDGDAVDGRHSTASE
jgi:hypothetical protein